MSQQVPRARDVVSVDYHLFELADGDDHVPFEDYAAPNGLVFSKPGCAIVLVGASSGDVNVEVEVRDRPPSGGPVTDGWDEVVDHSVTSLTGNMHVRALMEDPPDLPVLTPAGPGSYRVRVHARGRDIAPDGVAEEPLEDYLLVVWPAPTQPDTVHKQTDRFGADWRDQASGTA
ncbi:hypothetical protein [Streptomyces sp. 891-h]|uniref:hypothetical protein n=1 Tax=Streptomyces sp. 891-h TaxID=2720714 RepID=UPI001FAA7F09|nr:hypothetical protein [Streptomyces sp. 891-h]UNZ21334.1 hypothetical protein HC362_34050 [Streptomyces sp. 891-h]